MSDPLTPPGVERSEDTVSVLPMDGVEGPSVYVNDYRIAGPKPWGGGTIDEWLWLPWTVGLVDGCLVPDDRAVGWWWTVETIDRLSRKPFEQPDGPLARLVRLSHFSIDEPGATDER